MVDLPLPLGPTSATCSPGSSASDTSSSAGAARSVCLSVTCSSRIISVGPTAWAGGRPCRTVSVVSVGSASSSRSSAASAAASPSALAWNEAPTRRRGR